MRNLEKLNINITKILEEDFGYEMDDNKDYLMVLENFEEAEDSFEAYLHWKEEEINEDDIKEKENAIEEQKYYYNDYLECMNNTLLKLKYFKNEIDNNPGSLVDKSDYSYIQSAEEDFWYAVYSYIENIIKEKKLKIDAEEVHEQFQESLICDDTIDKSKLSRDALIIDKEIGWVNGNCSKSVEEDYLEDYGEYIIESDINYSTLKNYIQEIEIYLEQNPLLVTRDYLAV